MSVEAPGAAPAADRGGDRRRGWWGRGRRQLIALFWRVFKRARTRSRGLVEQPRLWVLALLVGALAAHAAVAIVKGIDLIHVLVFGGGEEVLVDVARAAPMWVLILAPTLGGVLIGLMFRLLCDRVDHVTVADVMEARARNGGRMPLRRTVVSAVAAPISLGLGASAGREGPAVVAAAGVFTVVARFLRLSAFERRTLLGCAVAAAVSASFNAPIAGALFALEVVLGHYAVRAFAPITVASVVGASATWIYLDSAPAFRIPTIDFVAQVEFSIQFPALFLLGLVSAFVAMAFMASIHVARGVCDSLRERLGAPFWVQTGACGLVVGLLAAAGATHVLGVGYQTTSMALGAEIGFWACVGLVALKTFASAVCMGGRFAAGVFSPALMLGALTGLAFGHVATEVAPAFEDVLSIYALAGMGAVAGAVLGAPISTTLIVFELTKDYNAALAVMISTSVATVATQQIFRKSYFHWQLARRGVDLIAGPEHAVLPGLTAGRFMRWRGSEAGASDSACWELARQGVRLAPTDDLRRAFELFRGGALTFAPVVDPDKDPTDPDALIGALFYVDALKAYNRALLQTHEEEHS